MAGHPVRLIDQTEAALDRGLQAIKASLSGLRRRGVLDQRASDLILAQIAFTTDIGRATGAVLAIEAIVEHPEAKAALFSQLAEVMGPDAVLASNTSSLSITSLAEGVPHPERFVGLHFFNPAPIMKLVEIVGAPETPRAILEGLSSLMFAWGKQPVTVRDVPGFIVNRVARPYYAEGFRALGEGIAPEAVDHALTALGGFRMGPLALADLIGHDVNYTVAASVHESYGGRTRFRPESAQKALVEAGRFGRKSEAGVYDYPAGPPEPMLERGGSAPRDIRIPIRSGRLAAIIDALRLAGAPLQIDPAQPEETLKVDETLIALGDGLRLSARPGVSVLLDQPRDTAQWPTWVATAATAEHAAALLGLAGLVDRPVLFVPDRPGQIVLRTLAQLANAAADAVIDEVATADGVDQALVFGANHPQGPCLLYTSPSPRDS